MLCRLRISLCLIALAALFPAAIRSQDPRAELRNIIDSTGQTVAIPGRPERILSLCTSATDTLLRLGESARLAGIDEYSRVVPGAASIPVLGRGSSISREQVLARRFDLAFVWWFQDDVAQLLAGLRVPVVKLRCARAAETPAAIRIIGQALGQTNAAEPLAQSVAASLALLRPAASKARPRVYIELYSPFKTSGRDSYLNDLIELAGARNIATDAAGSILLSSEHLLAADPQFVILLGGSSTPEQFARRAGSRPFQPLKPSASASWTVIA